MQNPTVEAYWQNFLAQTGRSPSARYAACFHFGSGRQMADSLLELVLTGKKRATASALPGYALEGEALPQVDDLIILTNFDGQPRCVVQVTAVTILPFRDITFDIAGREGEDENLESWRAGHIKFFTQDGEELGFTFSFDMPVVFEDFEVIYR